MENEKTEVEMSIYGLGFTDGKKEEKKSREQQRHDSYLREMSQYEDERIRVRPLNVIGTYANVVMAISLVIIAITLILK